jgi:hypothetical protein
VFFSKVLVVKMREGVAGGGLRRSSGALVRVKRTLLFL